MTENNKNNNAALSDLGATAINTEDKKRLMLRLNYKTETKLSTEKNSKDKPESTNTDTTIAPATVVDSANSKSCLAKKVISKANLKKETTPKVKSKPKDNIKKTATKKSIATKADSKRGKILPQSKISLTINGIEQEIKTAFTEYSKSNNITYHETLKRLWRLFELCPITAQGIESLEKAYELEGNKCLEKLSNTLVDTAKSMIGSYMLKHVNHPLIIASKNRAAAIVQELMNKNKNAKEWYEKVFISRNFIHGSYMIQKRLESPSFVGVGEKAIANYLNDNKAMIEAHHAEYGLDESHNRKATTYLRNLKRKEDTTDLSAALDAKISNDTSFEKTENKIKGRKGFKRNTVNHKDQMEQ